MSSLAPVTPTPAPRTRAELSLVRSGPATGARATSRTRDEDVTHGGVKSVTSALDVLDCFLDADELGVSDIARRLGVAKSTAHRLLTSLTARGFTDKNPETGQYRLGLHLFELGQIAGDRMRLRRTAAPLLEELRRLTGCTVHLSVVDGSNVVYLERLEAPRGMAAMSTISRRMPSHCTSSGKVITAFDPEAAEARKAAGFKALTSATIRTEADFDKARAEIRRRGVATNVDEALTGFSSVAAPVLDSSGRALAAISLVGTTDQFAGSFGRTAQLVSVAARRLARAMGI